MKITSFFSKKPSFYDSIRSLKEVGYCILGAEHYQKSTFIFGYGSTQSQISSIGYAQKTYQNLPADQGPGGRFRAYSRFRWDDTKKKPVQADHTDYVQSIEYNYEDGGKSRRFSPISPEFLDLPLVKDLVQKDTEFAEGTELVEMDSTLEIGLHQIRYKAQTGTVAYSSPTWLHRDDETLVFVHLFGISKNIIGGDSIIASNSNSISAVFRLQVALETLVLTKKMLHAVTPMGSHDGYSAYRDILLVTFHNKKVARREEKIVAADKEEEKTHVESTATVGNFFRKITEKNPEELGENYSKKDILTCKK